MWDSIIRIITILWNDWSAKRKRSGYSITWGGKKITGINRIGNLSMTRNIIDNTSYGSCHVRSFAPGLISELSFVLCLDRTSESVRDLTDDFISGTCKTLEIIFPPQKEINKENMQGIVSGVSVEAFIRNLDIIFEREEIIQYSFQLMTEPRWIY